MTSQYQSEMCQNYDGSIQEQWRDQRRQFDMAHRGLMMEL
jgi:hypothetical protein